MSAQPPCPLEQAPEDSDLPKKGLLAQRGREGPPSEFSAYCAFQDDRYRLAALISRDIRRAVSLGLVLVLGGSSAVPVVEYLGELLR